MIPLPINPVKQIVPDSAWAEFYAQCGRDAHALRSRTPDIVVRFIDAVAAKLNTLEPNGTELRAMIGADLLLSMDTFNDKKIDPFTVYQVPVPRLTATHHALSMLRMYHRRGPQSLIDWIKAHASAHTVRALVAIYEEEVLNIDIRKRLNHKLQ